MDDRNQKIKVLADYYKEKHVRVYEDEYDTLFCLYDIAKYVGDNEYMKITKKYDDKLKLTKLYPVCGRKKEMAFLTIRGLLKYLTNFDEFMDHLIELMFNNNILLDALTHPFSLLTDEQIGDIKDSNKVYVNQIEGSYSHTADEMQRSVTLTSDQINAATKCYNDASCIYFIRLYAAEALNSTKPVYKYGKTDNIHNRMKQYKGNPFTIEKIIRVKPVNALFIESMIKKEAKHNGEYTTYINLHELIITTDIEKYYKIVSELAWADIIR